MPTIHCQRCAATLLMTWFVIAASKNATAQTSPATVEKTETAARKPDVVYVPTPQEVVDKMLDLAEVKKGDVVLYGKYSGTEVSYEGKDFLILREGDILAIL